MQIHRKSPITGKQHTQEIDVTRMQLQAWQEGALIQTVMPDLTPSEREFIMTGMTDDDWSDTFNDSNKAVR
jgi:hypothetical protein